MSIKESYFGVDNDGIAVSGMWSNDSVLPKGQTLVPALNGEMGFTWTGSEWKDLRSILEKNKLVLGKRKEEYPPMENYLDGIVKGDQAQIDKYISDCLAVKERFPKE